MATTNMQLVLHQQTTYTYPVQTKGAGSHQDQTGCPLQSPPLLGSLDYFSCLLQAV